MHAKALTTSGRVVAALLLGTALVLAATQAGAADRADVEGLGLRGPVKQFQETRVTYGNQTAAALGQGGASTEAWGPGSELPTMRAEFDPGGRLTMLTRYHADRSTVRDISRYTYTESGSMARIDTTIHGLHGYEERATLALFDERGRKIEETTRTPSGAVTEGWVRQSTREGSSIEYSDFSEGSLYYAEETTFDADGNILSKSRRWPGADLHTWRYSYDGAGHLESATASRPGEGFTATWNYEYDSAGRVARISCVDSDGSVSCERRYLYGASGEPMAETATYYSAGEGVSSFVRSSYDAAGRLKQQTVTQEGTSYELVWNWTYDSQGRPLEANARDTAGGFFERTVYGYDPRSLSGRSAEAWHDLPSLEVTYDSAGRESSRTSRLFDGHGNLLEEAALNPDGSMVSRHAYRYEYDSRGNWIERRALFTDNVGERYDVITEEIRRTILYY